jgi:putative transposase
LVAYEDLQVRNTVRNRQLSKSISDAARSAFRQWLEYFGNVFGVVTVAAINILELALRTVGHMGTLNASGDIDKSIGEATPQCKPSRGKRKPKK